MQTQNIGTEGWSKTRTPLPPPPRRVREESRYSAADRPKRIFVAVAAGVGLLYLLMMLWAVQTLRTLQTVQGRVVGAWITHGKGTRYMLGFEYAADGRLWSAEDGVDKATCDRFVGPNGKVVPGFIQVHVSHVGPVHTALLRENETPVLIWVVGVFCLASVPWILYGVWYLWLAPARARHVCATGTASDCVVTDKRTRQKNGQVIYDLAYEFTVGTRMLKGKYSTDPGVWRAVLHQNVAPESPGKYGPDPAARPPVPVPEICGSVTPGEALTIIYLPENPGRHPVYELSTFVVESS